MAARPDRTARHSRKGAAAPFSTVAARFHALAVRKLYILRICGLESVDKRSGTFPGIKIANIRGLACEIVDTSPILRGTARLTLRVRG